MLDDKVGILDIKVKIDNHINCDVEMQVVDKKNIEKRILFYCSKMYVQSIKAGKDYMDLEKSIAILISNYELESLKEIRKYVSKWNLREEDYKNIVLTDDIEIVINLLTKVNTFLKIFLIFFKIFRHDEYIEITYNFCLNEFKKYL